MSEQLCERELYSGIWVSVTRETWATGTGSALAITDAPPAAWVSLCLREGVRSPAVLRLLALELEAAADAIDAA